MPFRKRYAFKAKNSEAYLAPEFFSNYCFRVNLMGKV